MKDQLEVDSRGIPLKRSAYHPFTSVPLFYVVLYTILYSIAIPIVYYGILQRNTNDHVKLAILAEYDLGYLYMTAFILKIGYLIMFINLGFAKHKSRVNLPDQHVYKVMGSKAKESDLGYVLLEQEGVLGRFNRAQRAVQNYHETYPQMVLYIVLAGFVYPFEVMIVSAVFALVRVMSAIGYTQVRDGRLPGYMLSLVTVSVLEVVVVVSGYRSIMM